MGAVSRPQETTIDQWERFPDAELDLDHSLEANPQLDELYVERREARRAEIVVCLDTSLSMTGKKMAITAVALAVIALQLDPEDLSIVNFESEANLLKPLGTRQSLFKLIQNFLELPTKGLTNIEAGLKLAKSQLPKGKVKRKAVILMTDGRFTAGNNPEYLAAQFPRLFVVQTGNPWASTRFCQNLAIKGKGKFMRVSKFEDLPKALYKLVQEFIR